VPRVTKTVCSQCGRLTCDGGIWETVRVVRLSDGKEAGLGHPDNLRQCTMRVYGRKREFHGRPVGEEITRDFLNWVRPSRVTHRRVE
jgi:hypothetical protein